MKQILATLVRFTRPAVAAQAAPIVPARALSREELQQVSGAGAEAPSPKGTW